MTDFSELGKQRRFSKSKSAVGTILSHPDLDMTQDKLESEPASQGPTTRDRVRVFQTEKDAWDNQIPGNKLLEVKHPVFGWISYVWAGDEGRAIGYAMQAWHSGIIARRADRDFKKSIPPDSRERWGRKVVTPTTLENAFEAKLAEFEALVTEIRELSKIIKSETKIDERR